MAKEMPTAAYSKVVVLGEAKSGTSGLFFKIKNSMPAGTRAMFEPAGYRYVPEPEDDRRPVLAKILFGNPAQYDYSSFAGFDKKIFIVRDPRDRIISETLFWVNESSFWDDDDKFEAYVDLLRRKEADPASVSLVELIKAGRRLDNPDFRWEGWASRIEQRYVWLFDFLRKNADYFQVKYEDFIAGRLGGLEAYLGFPLRGDAQVAGWAKIVVRTKGCGDWKNWFVPEDVDYFRPILGVPIRRLGYADDWALNPDPVIEPRFCTGYVENTIRIRRDAYRAESERGRPAAAGRGSGVAGRAGDERCKKR